MSSRKSFRNSAGEVSKSYGNNEKDSRNSSRTENCHHLEREAIVLSGGLKFSKHSYPHRLVRWHHHPEVEVHLLTSTSGSALIGNETRVFTPGSLYLIGSNTPHNWVSSLKPGESVKDRDVLIHYGEFFLHNLASIAPDLSPITDLVERSKSGLEFFGKPRERASEILLRMGDYPGPRRLLDALEVLEILAAADKKDCVPICLDYEGPLSEDEEDQLFDKALTYIYDNISEPISLRELAQHMVMGESSVSRLFIKATSQGFSHTVNQIRITEACRLLRTTSMPVSEICWNVGFTSISNFNRRFRERTGVTPSVYRSMDDFRR